MPPRGPSRAARDHEGIGIGTDFLNAERPLEGLENVESIVLWLRKTFGPEAAERLASANAGDFMLRTTGHAPRQDSSLAG